MGTTLKFLSENTVRKCTFGNPLNMKGQIISFEEYVELCGEEDELAEDWVYVEWDDGRVNCYPNNDSEDLIPF